MNEQFINDLSKELAKLGTIHSVGEEWISYTGKIPSGGIPYCGQEVSRETYSALWSWVQAQGLVKTEAEWQSIASSQNGNVPFYSSGNGTTTFRIPKLVGYIKGAANRAESGAYVAEGLPNIEGNLTAEDAKGTNFLSDSSKSEISESGAFHISRWASKYPMDNGTSTFESPTALDFDASRSNPIYGKSNHVTPETSCVLFGVYAFGTVSNPSDLNVSSLVSEIDNIKTSYLPKAGGTMTGDVVMNGAMLRTNASSESLNLRGGTNTNTGAYLGLYGKDSAEAGMFTLASSNGTNIHRLQGTTSGVLTWSGNNVVRSVNNTTADAKGNVSITTGTKFGSWVTATSSFTAAKDCFVSAVDNVSGENDIDPSITINGVLIARTGTYHAREIAGCTAAVPKGAKVSMTGKKFYKMEIS